MRTLGKIATLAAAGGLVRAACGSDSSSDSVARPSTTVAGAATTAKASATTAAGSATTSTSSSSATTAAKSPATTAAKSTATTKPGATATTKAGAAGTADELKTGSSSLGTFLVDGAGQTLYIFTKDTAGKPSTCVDACATTWPPLLASTTATIAGTGVEKSEITEIARPDGTKQVAYYGMPLYRFVKDTASGQTTGEGVNNFYVVNPEGSAIK